jgi:hypothetical protein
MFAPKSVGTPMISTEGEDELKRNLTVLAYEIVDHKYLVENMLAVN